MAFARRTARPRASEATSAAEQAAAPVQREFAARPSFAAPSTREPGGTSPGRLPDSLRAGVEALSGVSLTGVRVHYNSPHPERLSAHAYARGSEIHVAPGQESHLPHEAWHLVQQAQGRVRASMQMKNGLPLNADPALEREADVMGNRARSAGIQRPGPKHRT